MRLLNPRTPDLPLDSLSAGLVRDTIGFFEAKGKKKLKEDDRDRVWYRDFLEFQKEKRLFWLSSGAASAISVFLLYVYAVMS